MTHKHRYYSSDSSYSRRSEGDDISLTDNNVVADLSEVINTKEEYVLPFEIGITAEKAWDEKSILTEIRGDKCRFNETDDGKRILQQMLRQACADGLIQALECFVGELQIDFNMEINTKGRKETALHVACQHNQLPSVCFLLKNGAGVLAKQTDGYTPFHIACEKGYIDIVKELCKNLNNCDGHVIDMKQNDEWTGLHLATRNGHAKIVHYLLKNNEADANAADGNGKTSLHFACCIGYLDIVQMLVQHQQKNMVWQSNTYITEAKQYNGWNALYFAARYGHAEIVRYLITEGKMDVNSTWDSSGMTSLHLACQYGYVDIVRHLLQQKAVKVNKPTSHYGYTPFHFASIHGHQLILEELYRKDPSIINTCSTDLTSAEHFACQRGHFNIVQWMYPLVSSESSRCNKDGITLLHTACISGHDAIATFLIKNMSPDMLYAECSNGQTALHYAIQFNRLSIVECFFVHGKVCVDDAHEKTGMSCLQYACLFGNLDIAKYLIMDHHANVNHAKADSWTALHVASRDNQLDVVQFLLEVGDASVDCQTKDGWTALQLASRFGHLDVVQCLVHSGRSAIDLQARNGMTALHFAVSNGFIDVVQFLLKEGGATIGLKTSEGNTVLHIASARGSLGMIKLLLGFGAASMATNTYKETPIAYAKRILNPPHDSHSYNYPPKKTNSDIIISEIAELLTPFRIEVEKGLDDTAHNNIRRLRFIASRVGLES